MPFNQQFSFTRFCDQEHYHHPPPWGLQQIPQPLPLTEWEMGRGMGRGYGGIEHISLMSPRCLLKGPTEGGSSGQRRLGFPSCPTLGFQNAKAFTATKSLRMVNNFSERCRKQVFLGCDWLSVGTAMEPCIPQDLELSDYWVTAEWASSDFKNHPHSLRRFGSSC